MTQEAKDVIEILQEQIVTESEAYTLEGMASDCE